jgi:hypothetical protein
MAARKSVQAEIASTEQAVSSNRLDSVLGAARVEPTVGSEQRTDQVLVGADEPDDEATHGWFLMIFQA